MREVTAYRLSHIITKDVGSSAKVLINPHVPSKALLSLLEHMFGGFGAGPFATANEVRLNAFEKCSVHDVVCYDIDGRTVGRVEFHASVIVGGIERPFSAIRKWAIASESSRSWKCRPTDELILAEVDEIVCTLVWGGRIVLLTVLKPTLV